MPESITIVGGAFIPPEGKEVAWEGAKDLMTIRPDMGWLLGRFVQSQVPNLNGHIFDLGELQDRYRTVLHTPLNMLHKSRYTVGSFVGAELMYPTVEAGDGSVEAPFVEALASFWRGVFVDEWDEVQKAHDEGSLAYSMECVPESLECDECGIMVAYEGVKSRNYCDHMNVSGNAKWLRQPNFVGGAVIIPPTKPGWSGADVQELASYVDSHEDEFNGIMGSLAELLPHLDEKVREGMALTAVHHKAEGFEKKRVVAEGDVVKTRLSLVVATDDPRDFKLFDLFTSDEVVLSFDAMKILVEGTTGRFWPFKTGEDTWSIEDIVTFLNDVLEGAGADVKLVVPGTVDAGVAVGLEGTVDGESFSKNF